MSSIVVTHDIEEALGLADQLFVLHGGGVLAHGSPAELHAQKATNAALRQFLDGEAEGPLSPRVTAAPAAAGQRP